MYVAVCHFFSQVDSTYICCISENSILENSATQQKLLQITETESSAVRKLRLRYLEFIFLTLTAACV